MHLRTWRLHRTCYSLKARSVDWFRAYCIALFNTELRRGISGTSWLSINCNCTINWQNPISTPHLYWNKLYWNTETAYLLNQYFQYRPTKNCLLKMTRLNVVVEWLTLFRIRVVPGSNYDWRPYILTEVFYGFPQSSSNLQQCFRVSRATEQ
jgi:hypothetical protein